MGALQCQSQRAAQGSPVQSDSITPFPPRSRRKDVSLVEDEFLTFSPRTAQKYCPETVKPLRNALNHNKEPVTTQYLTEVFMTCSWISRVKKRNRMEQNRRGDHTDVT